MQTILGSFHPHLETALAEEILKYKDEDPLCPLLVLTPSDALRRRLKIFLTRERHLSFIHLQVLTFHQLSLKLFSEKHGGQTPLMEEDLFFEETLRHVIRAGGSETRAFAGIAERAGGCAALWQTLRDLRDGMVDPGVALEALREGHFAQRTSQRTSDLLALLATLLEFCSEKDIRDRSDLDKAASGWATTSPFLKQFRQIFYYGFYDLTQIQLDFFNAVSQQHPTTLFYPLLSTTPRHDGWTFAEHFYQRYVQGRGDGTTRNLVTELCPNGSLPLTWRIFDQEPQRQYQPPPADWCCQIFNTFGAYDEVSAVAKEILRLAGDDGLAFDEIGVVARSLDSYGAIIKEVFALHRIPIAGGMDEPLTQFPLTQAAILLLDLPAKDYLRSHVIDLLSSPYFQFHDGRESIDLRPDLWDLATRELGICKGKREWQRLEHYTARDLNLSQISMDDEPRTIKIPAAQLRVLSNILKNLAEDLNRLPPQAPWSQYSNIWKELLGKYLGIFPESIAGSHSVDSMVRDEITRVLDQIAQLDAVKPKVALHEFSQTFQRWLERSAIAASHPNRPGVTVSNATSARGLSFQALFLIGMNEGVFPRTIREDAFLRDRDREVLERDLGYKVSQKLAAFDEEKMLFALLVNAPRERLYCFFQRSDETGRVLAPSWYLAELKRALGTEYITEDTIPRSMTRKAESAPFHREEFLLPEELATRLILTEKESSSLIAEANLSPALFKQGLKTIAQIDLSTNRLDVFDGIIHPPAEYWQGLSQRGLSPTALELYARCPFQYFAHQVLGLERLEAPEDAMGPSMAEFGELGHSILKLAYQDLVRQGYFTGNAAAVSVEAILKAAAEIAFADYETNKPIGYPLIWETLRDALTQLILDVVSSDLQELTESGYVPGDFESDLTDRFPASWPEPLRGLTIRGRTDRIDIDQKQNRLRIVDYKFKFSTHPSTSDNNLSRAALRGEHLQPPFYSLLGQGKRATEDARGIATRVEAAFYYIASRWNNGPLITKSFAAEELAGKIGDELKGTIAQLVKGIRAGQFFIQRGDHCRYCEVSEVCRKNHPPSLWRAENDPLAGSHRRLREKDLSN